MMYAARPLVHLEDEGLRYLAHATERLTEEGNQDFTFRNPRLIERNLQEKLWVVVHLHVRGIDNELVAFF